MSFLEKSVDLARRMMYSQDPNQPEPIVEKPLPAPLLLEKSDLSKKLLTISVLSMKKYENKLKNTKIIVIIDYTKHSSKRRLYVVEIASGTVLRQHHVAHGSGSASSVDPGYAVKFSNTNMSKCSSVGAAMTAETYYGKYGLSLKIRGLEDSNSNIYARAIVFHKSDYVTDAYIRKTGRCGLSWGCPAVDPTIKDSLVQLIKNGVFVYLNGKRYT